MHTAALHLVLHGAIVLLFGVLLGSPYGRSISRGATEQVINSWRVAHQSLPIAGILMIAVAAVMSHFAVPAAVLWAITILLLVSSYSFCVSLPAAAICKHRGLTPDGKGWQKLAYYGNVVGAVLSIAACCVILYSAFMTVIRIP